MNKIIINIIISVFLLSITQLNYAQKSKTGATLFGYVYCRNCEKNIPLATITVKGTTIGTTTDESGHYRLIDMPEGTHTIIVRSLGHKPQEKEITIKQGETKELNFKIEVDVLKLEQVVVTGTRTKHYIKDVPVRTEVITAREIEIKNATNLFQVLEGTPGIRVEQQCQFCNFTMVRMQGLGAEHTQILINGQPMYSGLAGIYGLQQIGTTDIERIEVIKGAGSALYGSSAVAGAINIITKEPSLKPSTKVGLQFGRYNTNRYDISSSLQNESGNIGLNIFAQKLTGDPVDETSVGMTPHEVKKKDGITDRVASNLNNAGFGLYIDDAFSVNDKLVLRGRFLNEKRQGGIMDNDYYKNPFTDGTESITTDRYESELSYSKIFNDDSDLNFSLAYVNHSRDATNDSYLGDYMETHNDSVPDLRNMRPYLAHENSFTSALTYRFGINNHKLLIGTQGYYNNLKESGMYVIVDAESDYRGESYRSVSNKSAMEFGAFIQDEWLVNENFTVVPGVRFDFHKSEEGYKADRQVSETALFPKTKFDETSINPRIAIKYDFSRKITLRSTVGTGFRAPYGFSEDLHLCSGSPRVWKSSELKPETAVSYNLSADYYGFRFRVSANLFRTDLKDKIAFTDATAEVSALGYDYQWKNIDNAFVQGVEINVMANLSQYLDAGVDFTLNQGKYNNERMDWKNTQYVGISKYISRFPKTTGNIKLEYNPKDWTFAITGNYQGKMYIDYFNEEIDPAVGDQSKIKETDPFMLFNARISKKINAYKLYAGANNIFNYIQDEKHTDDAAFMYAPVYGTIFYGGITIDISY
jgi:outer membrane receptor for ferrienterochelin and colicins